MKKIFLSIIFFTYNIVNISAADTTDHPKPKSLKKFIKHGSYISQADPDDGLESDFNPRDFIGIKCTQDCFVFNAKSRENLVRFIKEASLWNKDEDKTGSIRSVNNEQEKELSITFFHKPEQEAMTITFLVQNIGQNPRFKETSIWGEEKRSMMAQTIDFILDQAKTNPSSSEVQHIYHLRQILHGRANSAILFNPDRDQRLPRRRSRSPLQEDAHAERSHLPSMSYPRATEANPCDLITPPCLTPAQLDDAKDQ
jgi:hypothetical protein